MIASTAFLQFRRVGFALRAYYTGLASLPWIFKLGLFVLFAVLVSGGIVGIVVGLQQLVDESTTLQESFATEVANHVQASPPRRHRGEGGRSA